MAVETKHNLVSLKRQLCLGNNDTNFIAKSKQIIEVVKKIVYKAVATPSTFRGFARGIRESCLWDLQLPTKAIAKKHRWEWDL